MPQQEQIPSAANAVNWQPTVDSVTYLVVQLYKQISSSQFSVLDVHLLIVVFGLLSKPALF